MTASKYRQTEDGYALIENMLVLPIVFLVVYALLFAGFILHAQCTIESAARRGVLYAGKLTCDPQYSRVTASAIDPGKGELNEISNEEFNFTFDPGISYKPYRYILPGGYYSDNNEQIKSYVRKVLDQSTTWMFKIKEGLETEEIKVIDYVLPDGEKVLQEEQKEVFAALQDSGKVLSFVFQDDIGEEVYRWTFQGSDIRDPERTVEFQIIVDAKEQEVLEVVPADVQMVDLKFINEGVLPGMANIKVQMKSYFDADRLYLYYYNPVLGALELFRDFERVCLVYHQCYGRLGSG